MKITAEHFDFLDDLRSSGVTNMFGAGPYIVTEFGVSRRESHDILRAWQKTFDPVKSSVDRVAEYEAGLTPQD